MADRNTTATFTFEEWREEFNELAVDVGDIATLAAGFTATDIMEAINELETEKASKPFAVSMAVALSG